MTPPSLDVATVHAKLHAMRELLDDLDGVGPVDVELLRRDRLLRYAVERILTSLVDLAVAVNGHLAVARLGAGATTYRESFALAERAGVLPPDLAQRLAPSAGLRNVLTHEYLAVELEFIVDGVTSARVDYREYVRVLARVVTG